MNTVVVWYLYLIVHFFNFYALVAYHGSLAEPRFVFYRVFKITKWTRGQYPAILTEQAWSINDLFILLFY